MMSSSEPKFSHASGFSSPVGTRRRFFEWVIKAAAGFHVSQDDMSDRKRLFLLASEPGGKKKVHNGGSFLVLRPLYRRQSRQGRARHGDEPSRFPARARWALILPGIRLK